MKMINFLRKFSLIFFILLTCGVMGQTIKGKVTDSKGDVVPFVNVVEKGTTNGTTTDDKGKFLLKVKKLPTILLISTVGFKPIEKKITSTAYITLKISEESVGLEEVVVTGNRAKPRTILNSPVPIDNVSIKELQATGQANIDQMLTYKIPSYNSSNQTVSDATAHFDPASLRGLGPSRTLVLVNGKRKNQSALVYVNDTPGKGEVGTDMKSIPTAALERVEVLRDGASAQYGSDAIAGVVNIILKKKEKYTQANISSGITSQGDGFTVEADVNSSFALFNKGFVNVTLGASHQNYTNRAGRTRKDLLFNPDSSHDTWIAKNPSLGMIIGQPEMQKGQVFVNAEFPLENKKTTLYLMGGGSFRKGKSFAMYRTPYWVKDPYNLLHKAGTSYQGFQPTFKTNIIDNMVVGGVRFDFFGFNADASVNYGGNSVDYTIGNTLNPSLKADSPTNFDAGGYSFSNIIGNFDVNRSIKNISVAFGVEARQERFKSIAGEKASYQDKGSQSFPGLRPENALNKTRINIGTYGSVDWDITDKLLLGGALRYENYSDFGGNTSWKINSRYKINDSGVLRASYSTGFRAPSLHQIYLSNIQTIVSAGTISDQGTFNNIDPVIKELGVASLFAETSKNISVGFTVKASRKFNISLDYYRVKVDNRVLFSGEIGTKDDNGMVHNDIKTILDTNKITSIKFFINAVNTITQGFDYIMTYRNIEIGSGKLGINLALNINNTYLEGNIKTPEKLSNYRDKIFNRKEQARITDVRPKTKLLFGANYNISKFNIALNNTYFGQVKWQHASEPDKDQVFSGKVITDISLNYAFSNKLSANIIVNNAFDVFPDEIVAKGDPTTNLGGRFKYPWEVNQFGFNGASFKAGLTFKF